MLIYSSSGLNCVLSVLVTNWTVCLCTFSRNWISPERQGYVINEGYSGGYSSPAVSPDLTMVVLLVHACSLRQAEAASIGLGDES